MEWEDTELKLVGNPGEFERKYVHDVYKSLADICLVGNPKPHNFVKDFAKYVKNNSIIVDIGCGSCRNHGALDGSLIIGCDVVEEFAKKSNRSESLQSGIIHDFMGKSIRKHIFDVGLLVGVLHHISTKERRINMLKLLYDSLVDDGIAIVASAGHKDIPKQNKPWHKSAFQRYFHFFLGGELESLCKESGFVVVESEKYSEGMWHVVVGKTQ